jgi:hypothetical protein
MIANTSSVQSSKVKIKQLHDAQHPLTAATIAATLSKQTTTPCRQIVLM